MAPSEKNKLRRVRYSKRSPVQRQEELLRRRASYAAVKKRGLTVGDLSAVEVLNSAHPPNVSPNESERTDTAASQDFIITRSRAKSMSNGVVSSTQASPLVIDSAFHPSHKFPGISGCGRRSNSKWTTIHDIPIQPWKLQSVDSCIYCSAVRFQHEVPGFCCGSGQVSLAPRELLPELVDLLTGDSHSSHDFRKHIRSYNNHLAFSSIGIKSDDRYCWSNKGVYTLLVQGMIFHYINSIRENTIVGSNLDLYFHETDGSVGAAARRGAQLCPQIVMCLINALSHNPYARFFKSLRHYEHLADYTIVLRSDPGFDQRTFNLPTVSQVGAIWKETDSPDLSFKRDIRVYVNDDRSRQVQYYYGCYDPLQYPLLYPRGEPGWHAGIKKNKKRDKRGLRSYEPDETGALISPSLVDSADTLLQNENDVFEEGSLSKSCVSLREYYCYLFQYRPHDKSYLLHFGRLVQQYAIDMYIKLENSRLDYYRSEQRQQDIRTDSYQSIVDSLSIDGQNDPTAVGRRFVLPSSFIGGPRDMRKRYVNAMSLVQKFGKPDLFLTMTCNPAWPEITSLLLKHEKSEDRPDLLARVFKSKLEELKDDIVRKQIFGPVAAYVYVVEFQKRGLPHVHWLVILKCSHKILAPDMYDDIISAELPQSGDHPFLRDYVIKHMLHGPCGALNPNNVCMAEGKCKNHYPKKFTDITHHGHNSYPNYRRRDNGDSVVVRNAKLDNRWVVPYNPNLLAKYNCHLNVEVCSDIKLVKYLYKYIYKGHDRVAYHIVGSSYAQDHDEINQFQSGRWVAAPEAYWRIYGFSLNEMHPPVIILHVHLENQHIVRFGRQEPLSSLITNPLMHKTMLTEFFRMNALDQTAKKLNLLYRDFPEHFVWNHYSRTWKLRSKKKVIGRLVTVNPCEGERFYERLLLNNVRAPSSSQLLRTVNGVEHTTFREAALTLGLLESDSYIYECLEEACQHQMSYSLRRLFATILVFCSPNNPAHLWSSFEAHLSHDIRTGSSLDDNAIREKTLKSIHYILQSMGRSIDEYSLTPERIRLTEDEKFSNEYDREKAIIVSDADLLAVGMLNSCQRAAFDAIMSVLDSEQGGTFFVDGPGGSGKTFLYRALLAYVRSREHIALAVATSGVAASLLPGGRTAHSRFKFPLEIDENADSKVSKQSSLAQLIKTSKLIIWDEASMANKCIIEALDKLLRDVCDPKGKFGSKVVLFGGDFRQTLPIVVGGSREDMVDASIVSSVLWPSIRKLNLSVNMRARDDPSFIQFLLSIGDGTHPYLADDVIQLPSHMCVPFVNPEESLTQLIDYVFPSFEYDSTTPHSVVDRAILTPKNGIVDDINARLIEKFPGHPVEYMSFDKTDDPSQQGDYEDFLNSVTVAGLPPHKLVLKVNCPVMLLRNLDPAEGLCNGTRLICRHLGPRLIAAEIAIGDYKGRHVFIPRIPLQASDRIGCPIPFKRHQFPVRLCFAMTINKAQGQTLDCVGIYLQEPVFSHGQLYVAISRARASSQVKVLVRPLKSNDVAYPAGSTKNVVYSEIFRMASGNP